MAQSTLSQSQTDVQAPAREPLTESVGILQQLRWALSDSAVMTRRNLIQIFRQPQLIVFALVQPVVFTLLFAFVFGGAIPTGPVDYIDYLIPGIIIQTVVFAATNTTIGLTDDLSKGMIDRFRSLPMSRGAVLTGRTLADALRSVVTMGMIIGVGLLIGFRPDGGVLGVIGGVLIAFSFGYAFTWISALIGLLVKSPETAQVAGFIWIFPLVFASSIFVPVQTIEIAWLKTFAQNSPITVIADASRAAFSGQAIESPLLVVFWIALIMAVFMPLAIRQYSRAIS
jgi:ABC-type multidrug transport system permease subunit